MDDIEFEPFENQDLKKIGTGNEEKNVIDKTRPFNQKKFKPRNYIILIILIIVSAGVFSFFYYQRTSLYPEQTKAELLEIRSALYLYKESFGSYPSQLTELTKSRPLRESWLSDSWDNPYRYEVDKSKQSFKVISSGVDGKFGTDDDIQVP